MFSGAATRGLRLSVPCASPSTRAHRVHRGHRPQLRAQGDGHHRESGRRRWREHPVHLLGGLASAVSLSSPRHRRRCRRQRLHRRLQPQLRAQGDRRQRERHRRRRRQHRLRLLRCRGRRDPRRPFGSGGRLGVPRTSPTRRTTASARSRAARSASSPGAARRPRAPTAGKSLTDRVAARRPTGVAVDGVPRACAHRRRRAEVRAHGDGREHQPPRRNGHVRIDRRQRARGGGAVQTPRLDVRYPPRRRTCGSSTQAPSVCAAWRRGPRLTQNPIVRWCA